MFEELAAWIIWRKANENSWDHSCFPRGMKQNKEKLKTLCCGGLRCKYRGLTLIKWFLKSKKKEEYLPKYQKMNDLTSDLGLMLSWGTEISNTSIAV